MSSYQTVTVVEQPGAREVILDVRLIHADAFLPLPTDAATFLALLTHGAERGALEPLADGLKGAEDATFLARGSEIIEAGELLEAKTKDTATYRVRVGAKASLSGLARGRGWDAAAAVWPPGVAYGLFDRKRLPKKEVVGAERLKAFVEILRTQPGQTGVALKHLGELEDLASPYAAEMSQHVYTGGVAAEAAVALALAGNPVGIGPLVLAAWQGGRPDTSPHERDAVLGALGWFGAAASKLAEPVLRASWPSSLALQFARWQVLGDEQARKAFLHFRPPADEDQAFSAFTERNRLVFGSPLSRVDVLVESVRAEFAQVPVPQGLGLEFHEQESMLAYRRKRFAQLLGGSTAKKGAPAKKLAGKKPAAKKPARKTVSRSRR